MELKKFYTAKNPNTPSKTLAELAKDESLDIRKAVAGNPNTPPEILTKLTNIKLLEDQREGLLIKVHLIGPL